MRAPPRILVLAGTRPEVIKLAPVVRALRRNDTVEVRVAYSGQHTDLVDQALTTFAVDLDYDLGAVPSDSGWTVPSSGAGRLMRPDQDLYHLAHGLLDGLREVVRDAGPDIVVVEGDTATVLFGALVGFFEGLEVAHVEAGLRSGDKWSPFPEEIFRRMTDVVADVLFAPTPHAAASLRAEGYPTGTIHVTGNTVVDAVLAAAEAQEGRGFRNPELARLVGSDAELILLTAHRRESFGGPLRDVFRAVRELVDSTTGVEVVFPVHPNPNVRGPAEEVLGGHPRIHLLEPLDYLDLVGALREARLVLTDSGGIQEEAPAFGTPVLVLRDVTERPEGVEAGTARLVGTDPERILAEARRLVGDEGASSAPGPVVNPYGDGRAGERIADVLVSRLTRTPRRTEDWEPGRSR